MLKQLIVENWKSFRYAELPVDLLTVLIGTNASGKSNIVEALELLQKIIRGEDIETALAGDAATPSIRGGVEWAAHKPETQFTLKVVVQGENEDIDYLYSITVETKPLLQILQESIQTYKNDNEIEHFILQNQENTNTSFLLKFQQPNNIKTSSYYDFLKEELESLKEYRKQNLISKLEEKIYEFIIKELENIEKNNTKNDVVNLITSAITNIFILNPVPSKMRNYSSLADALESDASNIAGVIAALPNKDEVEAIISAYAKDLPEGEIERVWSEKVGRFGTDAMLYIEERWSETQVTEIDARSMSDGTLRFLAILTALLTKPEGSQLVIEEIDNGLHPSRAELLVRMLREIGEKRKMDILVTTHNPALLDALGAEIVPFVVVAHRDFETGDSQLTILEEIHNFPKLFASASLGKLTTSGAIERSFSRSKIFS